MTTATSGADAGSTSCSSSAASSRRAARAQALLLAGQVRVGEGDRRAPRPQAGRPGRRRRRRSRVQRIGPVVSAAAGTSCSRARRVRDRPPTGRSASTSAPRPAASPTSSCERGASARLCSGRRPRPARRAAARRPAGRLDGAHQRARRSTPGVLPEPVDARRRSTSRSSRCALVLGPVAARFAAGRRPIVPLVKPQFEAGRAARRKAASCAIRPSTARSSSGWSRRPRELGLGSRGVDRLAAPGPAGQPRVPARPAPRPVAGGSTTGSTSRAIACGAMHGALDDAPPRVRVQPHQRRTPSELRERGGRAGAARTASTAGRARRASSPACCATAARDGRRWSSSAATARSCGRPGPWPQVDVPILGVNLGKVGFLSKVEADALESVLEQLVGGRVLDRRADGASRPRSCRPGGRRAAATVIALNDIVVARGSLARVVRLDVAIDESHVATFIADGLIVLQPDRLDRLLVLGRRPDPRPGQPEPGRDADRRLPLGDPLDRRVSPHQTVTVPGRRRPRGAPRRSTATRTSRSTSATSSRCAPGSRRSAFVEPKSALPFWDLLRHKVELLPDRDRERSIAPRSARTAARAAVVDLALIDRLRLSLSAPAST